MQRFRLAELFDEELCLTRRAVHAHHLAEMSLIEDFHTVREGRNGKGDRWHSDGKLYFGVIAGEAP